MNHEQVPTKPIQLLMMLFATTAVIHLLHTSFFHGPLLSWFLFPALNSLVIVQLQCMVKVSCKKRGITLHVSSFPFNLRRRDTFPAVN